MEHKIGYLSTEKLTDNPYLKGAKTNARKTEGSLRNSLIGANAKGTFENNYLDPIPQLNKIGQIYSDLISNIGSYVSARNDSLPMDRENMDYTNNGVFNPFDDKDYWWGFDLNGDGQVGLDDAIFGLIYYTNGVIGATFDVKWYENIPEDEDERVAYLTDIYEKIFIPESSCPNYDSINLNDFIILNQDSYPQKTEYYNRELIHFESGKVPCITNLGDSREHITNGTYLGLYNVDYPTNQTVVEIMLVLAEKMKQIDACAPDTPPQGYSVKHAQETLTKVIRYSKENYISCLFDEMPFELSGGEISYVNLLMPRYGRRVEVEDLDENFWVLGQITDALVSTIWQNHGLLDVINNIVDNIYGLDEQAESSSKTISFFQKMIGIEDLDSANFGANEKENKAYNLFENVNLEDFQIVLTGTTGNKRYINLQFKQDEHPCIPKAKDGTEIDSTIKQIVLDETKTLQDLFDAIASIEDFDEINSSLLLRSGENEEDCLAKYYFQLSNSNVIDKIGLARLPYQEDSEDIYHFIPEKFFHLPNNFNIVYYDKNIYNYSLDKKRIELIQGQSNPTGFIEFIENYDGYTLFSGDDKNTNFRYPTLFVQSKNSDKGEIICVSFRNLCLQARTPIVTDSFSELEDLSWLKNNLGFYKTSYQVAIPNDSEASIPSLKIQNNIIEIQYFTLRNRKEKFAGLKSDIASICIPVTAFTTDKDSIKDNYSFSLDEQAIVTKDDGYKVCELIPRMCGAATDNCVCYAGVPYGEFTGIHNQIAKEFLLFDGQQYFSTGNTDFVSYVDNNLFQENLNSRYSEAENNPIPENVLSMFTQDNNEQSMINSCYSLNEQLNKDNDDDKAPYGLAFYKAKDSSYLRGIKINGIAFKKEEDCNSAYAPMTIIMSTPQIIEPSSTSYEDDWKIIVANFVPNSEKLYNDSHIAGPAASNLIDYNNSKLDEKWCTVQIDDDNYRKEFMFEFDCSITERTGFIGLGYDSNIKYSPKISGLLMCGETAKGGPVPFIPEPEPEEPEIPEVTE